ncbi:hypothetical protein FA15DRAFT_748759 [Coprinopsis marcescibilis]|uniref:Protein kinase domain-containing protein n=1 Tax=Coprinopsis marcescibilis TaxID=230819 RepID=A0A5C3KPH8_COPMA|nr:hypothetical protein FA15DRAFT_748759 [Coprinopsis marcescibilis]
MPVRVIAFEVDDTLWRGQLDENKFGKGRDALPKLEDNLEKIDDYEIRDRSNHKNSITLFRDVPKIIHDIRKRGIKLAIVSSNSSKALCNRALYHYKAYDTDNELKPIISMVVYNELGKDQRAKVESFKQIQEWSQASHKDIVYFDSNPDSKEVQDKLGVKFEQVSRSRGITWDDYRKSVEDHSGGGDPYDTPFYNQPEVGKALGSGKFGTVYESPDDPQSVIKVLKFWTKESRRRFLEIYSIIKKGKPFDPGNNNDDQYILMVAFEIRNLEAVGQLLAPKPEQFTGWLRMTKIAGTRIWKTPLYKKHPFSVSFQEFIKTAFHLAVDEIEDAVKKYGLEHRDAHLANVYFTMDGDQPVKGHLLDWGIAVKMKWDGKYYIRGDDKILWQDSEAGAKYTKEEFRRYWITWMVKTEYEANMKRNAITESDGYNFLKDLDWWFKR